MFATKTSKIYIMTGEGSRKKAISVLNPGEWFGKVRIITVAMSYWPNHYAIEADSIGDAIDTLVESDEGICLRISDEDMPDYQDRQDDINWTGSGIPYDSDNIFYDDYHNDSKYAIRYYGEGLPINGILADYYPYYEEMVEEMFEIAEYIKDDKYEEYNQEIRAIADMVYASQDVNELFACSRILFDYLEEHSQYDIYGLYELSIRDKIIRLCMK